MKKLTKSLLLVLCAILLIVGTVMGTVAYLTSVKTVKNVFTVGNVEIDLNETDVDNDNDTKANAYKLVPGIPYTKDPTVTVLENSEPCYVRTVVTVSLPNWTNENELFVANKTIEDTNAGLEESQRKDAFQIWAEMFAKDYFLTDDGNLTGFNTTNWKTVKTLVSVAEEGKTGYTITYYIQYQNIVGTAAAKQSLVPIFTQIRAPKTLTNAQLAALAGMKIDVEAHAIQSEGFTDANDAWAAFEASKS